MRLKENSDNYRAAGLQRKLKTIPDAPKHRTKKNTRRWCKGVVGRKHDYAPVFPQTGMFANAGRSHVPLCKVPTCTVCGRQDTANMLWRRKDGTYGPSMFGRHVSSGAPE